MIRKTLIVILLAFSAISAMAQYAEFEDYTHTRTKGMIDASYEFVDQGNAYTANIGFIYELASRIYVGARVGYTLYRFDKLSTEVTTHNINVPLEIGYNSMFGSDSKLSYNIYGGIRGQYCVANSVKVDGKKYDWDTPDGLSLTWTVGARIFLSDFFVGAAYNFPVKKSDDSSFIKPEYSSKSYLSASIGFLF